MTNGKETTASETAERKSNKIPIENLRTEVDPAVFAGTCAAEGWMTGCLMSRHEFFTAVKRFLESPINGSVDQGKKEAK